MQRPRFLPLALALVALALPGLHAAVRAAEADAVTVTPVTAAPAAPAAPDLVAALGDRWLLAAGSSAWQRTSASTSPWTPVTAPAGFSAPAASSGVADGRDWLLVGGRGLASVSRLSLDGNTLAVAPLPPLPAPRAHAALALAGRKLHVIGGDDADGRPTASVFILDLAAASPAWQSAADFPGGPVSSAAALAHYNEILVVGGLDSAGAPRSATWALRLRPLDGTTFTGWQNRAPSPSPLAAPSILPSATAHFLVFAPGLAAPAVYNSVVDAWVSGTGASPVPASGILAAASPSGPLLLARDGSAELRVVVAKTRFPLALLDYIAIGLYFVAMVWVGLALSGKGETSAQFALGNRDVKWWAAGISMFATGASSISFMAIPALAFTTNLVMFFPGIMMIAGFFISAFLIYPLLRKLEITSTYEYLHRRFNRGLRLIASAQCILFQTVGRMSVILVLPSLAISAFTGLDVAVSVLLMGVLTTIYTAIGGFNAVIWTDVFQGVLMIAAPLLVIGYAIGGSGGDVAATWQALEAADKLRLVVTDWDFALPVVWFLLLGGLYNIVGGVGDQPVIQRVFSVPMNEVRRTALMSTTCGIVISIFTYGMGLAIYVFYKSSPQSLGPAVTNDQIVPLFIVQNLPAGICGLVIASIFAAAMSTLSSSMNSVATLVCEDFYKPLFPNSSDASRVRLMKVVSYAVGAIGTGVAILMAKQDISSMFATWNTIVALLGGGFGGIYILGVFTTRANSAGAIAGGVASIIATTWVNHIGGVHWAALTPFAVTVCLVVGYVVSVVTGGSTKNLSGLTAFTTRS